MSSSKMFKTFLMAVGIFLTGHSFAADSDANADANDIAIHGYDTVAYFTESKPTQGSTKFTATYKNTIYQFASSDNRDKFRANPEKYAPQFGGHCAMGVALNKKLDVDPTAWRIVEGKLYLNLNKQVQEKWLSDISGNLKTAYEIWPSIKDKPASSL
jgi:YHS domain-containing protein